MAKQKKPIHRVQMTEGKRNIIHQPILNVNIRFFVQLADGRWGHFAAP